MQNVILDGDSTLLPSQIFRLGNLDSLHYYY